MGFPRQEHWSGLPFPSPGDLPSLGIESMSPALAGRFSTTEPPAKFGYKAIRTPKYTPLLSLDLLLILDKIHLSHLVFYVSDHFIYFGLVPANQESSSKKQEWTY